MALKIDPKNFGKRDDFSYYGRVLYFRQEESDADHKQKIGADPQTSIPRLHIKIAGESIEWVGPDGNVREFWADMCMADGSEYEGRGNKLYHTLAPIIAPVEPDECLRGATHYKDKQGNPTPGLGYDIDAPDFPECLEGKVFKVAHKWISLGTNRETKEEMRFMVPALTEEMPSTWVFQGERRRVTYKGRPGDAPGAGPTAAAAVAAAGEGPADPVVFFEAISGVEFKMATLLKACKGVSGLGVDPYRSLIASKKGLEALANCPYVDVSGGTVELVEVPETVAEVAALLKGAPTPTVAPEPEE